MSIFSRFGATSRLVAAAAVSFSLFTGVAMAENGYVDVRVRDDSAGCGPVVLKWPADIEEREYDPNPGANDPKLEMAETRPLPVIHHHPALNAGDLYLPPQDGIYRHYFPESEAPPRLRRWSRAEYEAYLREHNPSVKVPLASGEITADRASVPAMVIVPTGMITPPASFTGGPEGYVPVRPAVVSEPIPVSASPEKAVLGVPAPSEPFTLETAPVPSSVQTVQIVQPDASRTELGGVVTPMAFSQPAELPTGFVNKETVALDEGTGSFIKLSEDAEKIPYVEMPSALTPTPTAPAAAVPATATAPETFGLKAVSGMMDDVVTSQQVAAPLLEPGDARLPMTTVGGACGAPVCR